MSSIISTEVSPQIDRNSSNNQLEGSRFHAKYMTITTDSKYPVLYKCNICSAKLTREYSLRLHLLSHFNVKRYQCDICSKRYSSRQYLLGHIEMHKDGAPLLCPEPTCKRTFRHSMKLACHRRKTGHGVTSSSSQQSIDSKSLESNSCPQVTIGHKQEIIFEVIRCPQAIDLMAQRIRDFDVQQFITSPLVVPYLEG
mmetsp:Transcript_38446/g.43655  ORF Transcript_38446/g.43655 Transcript_38446/m.43655 type:complete len:197 (-) Transcript_38446:549-1139(-)